MNKEAPETNGANGVNGHTNGVNGTNGHAGIMADDANKTMNGHLANGLSNGAPNGDLKQAAKAQYHASRPEGVDGVNGDAPYQNEDHALDHHVNGD